MYFSVCSCGNNPGLCQWALPPGVAYWVCWCVYGGCGLRFAWYDSVQDISLDLALCIVSQVLYFLDYLLVDESQFVVTCAKTEMLGFCRAL